MSKIEGCDGGYLLVVAGGDAHAMQFLVCQFVIFRFQILISRFPNGEKKCAGAQLWCLDIWYDLPLLLAFLIAYDPLCSS